jgi:hypothetical protein
VSGNPDQALFGSLLGQAFGHTLKQVMAAVCRKYDSLAAFCHDRSRFALQCNMANNLALLVARNHRNKLAAFHPFPVPARREHVRVNVMMAIDFEEAASDSRCVALLWQIDQIFAGGRSGRRR